MQRELRRLTETFAQPGKVRWIGVRPDRRVPMRALEQTEINFSGLVDDRRTQPGKRAVSLIQWEHLSVIASLAGRGQIDPESLRRNVGVSGINLLGLRKSRFRLGSVVLKGTGICAPCSRMEETLGTGGYTSLRGHGGITAEVLEAGELAIGDLVVPMPETTET